MRLMLFDFCICQFGEGVFWYFECQQFFWFDILGCRLLSCDYGCELEWCFDECVLVVGWIDCDILLIVSEIVLFCFDLCDGSCEYVILFEVDNFCIWLNDGCVDFFGGFWIGIMVLDGSFEVGVIYWFYWGKLVKLCDWVLILNVICFLFDGVIVYYVDMYLQMVWQ